MSNEAGTGHPGNGQQNETHAHHIEGYGTNPETTDPDPDHLMATVESTERVRETIAPEWWLDRIQWTPWDYVEEGEVWYTDLEGETVATLFEFDGLDEEDPEDAPLNLTATCLAVAMAGKHRDSPCALHDEVLGTARLTAALPNPEQHRALARRLKGLD